MWIPRLAHLNLKAIVDLQYVDTLQSVCVIGFDVAKTAVGLVSFEIEGDVDIGRAARPKVPLFPKFNGVRVRQIESRRCLRRVRVAASMAERNASGAKIILHFFPARTRLEVAQYGLSAEL